MVEECVQNCKGEGWGVAGCGVGEGWGGEGWAGEGGWNQLPFPLR